MKKLILLFCIVPLSGTNLKRCHSLPIIVHPLAPQKLTRHDHYIINIPHQSKTPSDHTHISIVSDDEHDNRCPAGKYAIIASMIAGGVGMFTGILTATVTLIVHFTMK